MVSGAIDAIDRVRHAWPRAPLPRQRTGHEDHPVQRFQDQDEAYLTWVAKNPDAFVLNTYRNPRANYLRLHRASCPRISGLPANGVHWTVDYIKVCGSRAELETWARVEVGGQPWECPTCM